jgi:calpain family cysteine protease
MGEHFVTPGSDNVGMPAVRLDAPRIEGGRSDGGLDRARPARPSGLGEIARSLLRRHAPAAAAVLIGAAMLPGIIAAAPARVSADPAQPSPYSIRLATDAPPARLRLGADLRTINDAVAVRASAHVALAPEPALGAGDVGPNGAPIYESVEFRGPLFSPQGPVPEDVVAGSAPDCFVPTALSSIAAVRPDVLQSAIVRNADGTHTATFRQKNEATGRYDTVRIGPMSRKLYVLPGRVPVFGAGGNVALGPDSLDRMVLWFPLLEKGYAAWKGSYGVLARGGSPAQVFSEILGADPLEAPIVDSKAGARELFARVKSAFDHRRPVALSTYEDGARYRGTQLLKDHGYSVLGYKVENGKPMLLLRNPWGRFVPQPDLGKGKFWMEVSEAVHAFDTFFSVQD